MRAFFKYYLFWILFFVIQKPLFMLANLSQMGELYWQDWFRVIWHALPLDISTASYITAMFGLLLVGYCIRPSRVWSYVANVYTALVLLVALLVFIGDTGVFPYWGFHLDRTVFAFLASPIEVLACAQWWVWLSAVLLWLGSCTVWFLLYRRIEGRIEIQLPAKNRLRVAYTIGLFLVTALLFLPIRGSLTTSTMNTGRVYFSDRQMLNMAAINPVFNLMESLGGCSFDTQRYTYMPTDEALQLVSDLLPNKSGVYPSLLTTPRPNIILLILESFSSNAIEAMPNMQRLAAEGVFFSDAYASSYRTDRGVVAVMSGFPGQPTSSLMTSPTKSQHLPQLGRTLAKEGYQLKFWYGGDEDFTSMRSYLVSGGFADRVSDHSFPVSQRLSKWGVHDHLLFRRAAEEICAREADTCHTLDVILSLSSHEPFEVPATKRFENPFLNSVAYTDSCLGAFVDSLRQSPAWGNTLLVLVADHGYPYPAGTQNYEPRRYSIPMIWSGGAVGKPCEIGKRCSQIDLVPTLLAQMQIDYSEYQFGKNVLDSASVPFAFYSFNDGFALLTAQDSIVIDAKVNKHIMGDNPKWEAYARAFVQRVMEVIETL